MMTRAIKEIKFKAKMTAPFLAEASLSHLGTKPLDEG